MSTDRTLYPLTLALFLSVGACQDPSPAHCANAPNPFGARCDADGWLYCKKHDQCGPGGLCDLLSEDQPRAEGRCLDPASIVAVNPSQGNDDQNDGTAMNPVKTLRRALALVTNNPERMHVLLAAGEYEPPALWPPLARLYGPRPQSQGTPLTSTACPDSSSKDQDAVLLVTGPPLTVSGPVSVTLDSVVVAASKANRGALCTQSGTLRLWRSMVCGATDAAVIADGSVDQECAFLDLQEDVIRDNPGRALWAKSFRAYRAMNSLFLRNGTGGLPAVDLWSPGGTTMRAAQTFRMNTLYRNGKEGLFGGLYCQGDIPLLKLEGSLFAENSTDPNTRSQLLGCDSMNHDTSALGPTNGTPDSLETHERWRTDLALNPDGTLKTTSPCKDFLDPAESPCQGTPRDLFGTPRPQGQKCDVGTHELPRAP